MPTVLLARHGETRWNREGRKQGWARTELTDRGHEQARTLADHLADAHDVDRLHTSDLPRAVQTADHLADAVGVEPDHDDRWRERDFGHLQGHRDVYERFPEHDVYENGRAAFERRPESGESRADLAGRVEAAWADLVADLAPDATALVVSHGGPLRLTVGRARGLDPVEAARTVTVDNCGLTTVTVDPASGDRRLVAANDTAHL